jgi:hypothetical protein
MWPAPVGHLKHATDSATASWEWALPNPTPTYFDATCSDNPYGGVMSANTAS